MRRIEVTCQLHLSPRHGAPHALRAASTAAWASAASRSRSRPIPRSRSTRGSMARVASSPSPGARYAPPGRRALGRRLLAVNGDDHATQHRGAVREHRAQERRTPEAKTLEPAPSGARGARWPFGTSARASARAGRRGLGDRPRALPIGGCARRTPRRAGRGCRLATARCDARLAKRGARRSSGPPPADVRAVRSLEQRRAGRRHQLVPRERVEAEPRVTDRRARGLLAAGRAHGEQLCERGPARAGQPRLLHELGDGVERGARAAARASR
jgi:hypothetical protein